MSETNETIVNPCSQPDRAMNAYLRYPDTFAQAVNIAMDQEWLRPEDLIPFERDRNYRFESGPLKELSRDVLMARTRKGEVIGLIGIENQFYDDKYLIPRILAYDAIQYLTVVNERKEKSRKQEEGQTGEDQREEEPIPPVKTIVLNFTKTRMKDRRLSDLWPKDLEDRVAYNDYSVRTLDIQHLPPKYLDKWMDKYEVARLFSLFTPEGVKSARFSLNDLGHLKEVRDVFRELTGSKSHKTIFKTLADVLDDENRREESMTNPITELFIKEREEALAKKEAEVTARVKAETANEYEAKNKQMLKSFALTLAADGQPVQKISLYTKLSEDEVRMILAEQSPEYHV